MNNLCIKYNNTATNDPCDICGGRCDPWVGPEMFVEGTWRLVCDDCACKLAPELFTVVREWRELEGLREQQLEEREQQDHCDQAHAAALGMTVEQMFQWQADEYVRSNYPERGEA